MTKEEMIFFLNECAEDLEVDHNLEICGMKMEKLQECADAFREGAKALKRESCEDAMRRLIKDKINTLEDIASTANSEGRWVEDEKCCYTIKVLEELVDDLEALSPVTPQESILDKIRDEIVDTGAYEQEVNGKTEFLKGISYCLDVIDKFRAESDEEETGKEILAAMKESAEAVKNSPKYDFSCVTPLFDEGAKK